MTTHIPRPDARRIEPVTAPSPTLQRLVDNGTRAADGRPLDIFAILDNHPKLHEKFLVFAGYLLNGTIPGREREIVILRVGANCRSVYEFGQHTLIGKREGLTDGEVAALHDDSSGHEWSSDDAALVALADELCADHCVSDATWDALKRRWSDNEIMELLLVAGNYMLVSGFLNSVGAQLDAGVPGWPNQ